MESLRQQLSSAFLNSDPFTDASKENSPISTKSETIGVQTDEKTIFDSETQTDNISLTEIETQTETMEQPVLVENEAPVKDGNDVSCVFICKRNRFTEERMRFMKSAM